MSFTGPTSEIGLQGTLPLSYECSGTIYRGQGVICCGDMQVKAPGSYQNHMASGCVGVAEYKQTDGDWIGVYGPGAIVRVIISGSNNCSFGEHLLCVNEGKFAHKANIGSQPSGISAIALEDQATADGTARVLLH